VRQRLRQAHTKLRQSGADYLAYASSMPLLTASFPFWKGSETAWRPWKRRSWSVPGARPWKTCIRAARPHRLRRVLWPLRQAVQAFGHDDSALVTASTRPFLRDCYDHILQLLDVLENYRELIAGLMEMYLSSQSNHLNEVMKVLTIISTIFMPLSFVAGVYGMNFKTEVSPWNMPELSWPGVIRSAYC